jgi:hypothetical protein
MSKDKGVTVLCKRDMCAQPFKLMERGSLFCSDKCFEDEMAERSGLRTHPRKLTELTAGELLNELVRFAEGYADERSPVVRGAAFSAILKALREWKHSDVDLPEV